MRRKGTLGAMLVAMLTMTALLGATPGQAAVFCEVNEEECTPEHIVTNVEFALVPKTNLSLTVMVPTAEPLLCPSAGFSAHNETSPEGTWTLEPWASECGGKFYLNCKTSFEPLPYVAQISNLPGGAGEIDAYEGSGEGTMLFKGHCDMPYENSSILVDCMFSMEELDFEFEGGKAAVARTKTSVKWMKGSTFLCSSSATLKAEYKVTSPAGGLYLTSG